MMNNLQKQKKHCSRLILLIGLTLCVSLEAQQGLLPKKKLRSGRKSQEQTTPPKLPTEGDSPILDYLGRVLQKEGDVRRNLEIRARASGEQELAKWLQSNAAFRPMMEMKYPEESDPPMKLVSFESADLLAEQQKWDEACEAYLVALRVNPNLFTFSSDHRPIKAFRQADRLLELVEFFDSATLQKMDDRNHGMEGLFFAALGSDQTQASAYALLERVFQWKPYSARLLLQKYAERDFWKEVPNPSVLLRFVFLPKNLDEPNWERLNAELYYWQVDQSPKSQFSSVRQILYQGEKIKDFALEIRRLISEHPSWESGWAILALMESASGNHAEVISILRTQFLSDHAIKIPPRVAWALGESLAWKDRRLDLAVIELLEKSLTELSGINYNTARVEFHPGGPQVDSSLRFTPIRTLAELYAANGRKSEARQLLYGLIGSKDQHPLLRGYVINEYDPSRQYTQDTACISQRCNACHREVKSLYDHITFSDTIREVGYPVDSYLALSSLDRSYNHILTSSPGWIDSNSTERESLNALIFKEHSDPLRYFEEQMTKTSSQLTLKSISDALDRDTFWRYTKTGDDQLAAIIELIRLTEGIDEQTQKLRELVKHSETVKSKPETGRLNLFLSVRGAGETAEPMVFSPFIEMLELAIHSQERPSKQEMVRLDRKLERLSKGKSSAIHASIAATVFAFLRGDWEAADKRMKKLLDGHGERRTKTLQTELGFWLVARYALADNRTKIAGEQLANLAIAAAEKESDPRWKQGMLSELESLRR